MPASTSDYEHATALIRAFVVPKRRARYLGLLASPRGRAKLREYLAHFSDLDPRVTTLVTAADHSPTRLGGILRAQGAPPDCVLLSEDAELDGQRLVLDEALRRVIGNGMGTFVSCIPGQLAYFEGEYAADRYLLKRCLTWGEAVEQILRA